MTDVAPERTDPDAPRIFQKDQPDGVPPLELTGERTLPDVPEENYWYQRHLVVYEWIAERVERAARRRHGMRRGLRLRRAGAHARGAVVGVDANPEAHAHAAARYARPGLRFERTLIDTYDEPCDAVVFLQTIEHVTNPGEILEHFRDRRRLRAASSTSPRRTS